MEIVIDVTSPVHLYVQIADQLRHAIAAGDTVAGTDLSTGAFPSLWDIAHDADCAYNTARRAVSLLKEEGLVSTVPGRGTFVRHEG